MAEKVQGNSGQKKEKKGDNYRAKRWKYGDFWQPGDPLTETELKMLRPIKEYYKRHGYPPARGEMANAGALRQRFRIWKDVLEAAGVPPMNDPECQLRKQKAREWEERVRAEHIRK